MTVRELLCLCKNVNYGYTKVTVFDRNSGMCVSTPGGLPEWVKRAHVSEYVIGELNHKWLTRITIWIEERCVL